MPDRYLVTHAITKDVKDDDLKDFLQESIVECFQILNNGKLTTKCGLGTRNRDIPDSLLYSYSYFLKSLTF